MISNYLDHYFNIYLFYGHIGNVMYRMIKPLFSYIKWFTMRVYSVFYLLLFLMWVLTECNI